MIFEIKGESTVKNVLDMVNIGIHFFTSLSILSLVVFRVSLIICEIQKRWGDDRERLDYFYRLRNGFAFRLLYSAEDVWLLLMLL